MTVLRGQVAVVRSDGSALQPAPSGTTVYAGDEIRTLGATSALITFFSGTEIELEQETVIAIEQVAQQGNRVDISLKQAFGTTVNRVQTLAGSGSTYRIDAGGAVALVRGTTFVVIGPVGTAAGNIVIIVCGADCTPASTFVGCPLGPYIGYGVQVENGKVESPCIPFAVPRNEDLTTIAYDSIATIEQQLQGDTGGVPAGQVQPGQRQEIETRNRRRIEDDDPPKETTPAGTETLTATINDVSVYEGQPATFTVALSGLSQHPITLNYTTANGSAVAPGDYTPVSGTLTIPVGVLTGTIVVPTVADSTFEQPETFTVNLSGASWATVTDAQGIGSIFDAGVPPPVPSLSINDVTTPEGTAATFTVTLSNPSARPVTVNYVTTNGSAIAPGDFTTTSGTLTIPVGATTATIVVPTIVDTTAPAAVRPTAVEPPETFTVDLSNPNGATISDPQGVATIVDPALQGVSIDDVVVTEGQNAVFTIRLTEISSGPVIVNYVTANNTAIAPADYTAASGSVTIPVNATTAQIVVPTIADAASEPAETFFVNLTGATGAPVVDPQGLGTIVELGALTVSISDVSVTEGADATFTVSLSAISTEPVTVSYATANGTAAAGADYTAATGTVTIPPGSLANYVVIRTLADTIDEPIENFAVNLSNATFGAIVDAQGVGTIIDDDTAIASVNDVTVTEGATATFTISLSNIVSQPVVISYATTDGTAASPADYTAAAGVVVIPAGTTSAQVNITTVNDTIDELNETYTFALTGATGATIGDGLGLGTILDDDLGTISINDVSVAEGGIATFTVTLSLASGQPVSFNFATSNGTAVAPGDYTAASSSATIPAGSTTVQIAVPTASDTIDELDETFNVTLSGVTGATIADAVGVATITDDDTATISIADVSVTEGSPASFTVSLTTASSQAVSVNYTTSNGTAIAPGDYTAASSSVSIPAGSTSVQIVVPTVIDTTDELDETFNVTLSGAIGASITDATAVGTILDDDSATLSINDVSQAEGNDCFNFNIFAPCGTTPFNFTVTLSTPSDRTVTVNYTTNPGTAVGGALGDCEYSSSGGAIDYETTSGTLTFNPGVTTQPVTVLVCADNMQSWFGTLETDETFTVTLNTPSNATISDGSGLGTIVNDDVEESE